MGYIERCLNSVDFADEIIVIDSYSTDGTYEYLQDHPKVKVIQNPFENFTSQKSFALKQASNDWILFLDADEVVPDTLKSEILGTINGKTDHAAYWFYRKFMFEHKPLHFSGWQTDKNYRLFRKSKAKFSDRKIVHETLVVEGTSGILKEKLIHFSYKNYESYKNKMLYYGRLKAREGHLRNKRFRLLNLIYEPAWKFFVTYFIRLGILDGRKGITICYLNSLSNLERCKELKRLERASENTPQTSVIFSTSSK